MDKIYVLYFLIGVLLGLLPLGLIGIVFIVALGPAIAKVTTNDTGKKVIVSYILLMLGDIMGSTITTLILNLGSPVIGEETLGLSNQIASIIISVLLLYTVFYLPLRYRYYVRSDEFTEADDSGVSQSKQREILDSKRKR